MTKLSVNINKIATLRNARGSNNPNLIQVAMDCIKFGAQGITVHPRPDERHIKYSDVLTLSPLLTVEFNIEGNPDTRFIELVKKVKPAQVTLVPDTPDAITSNAGWDTIKHNTYLTDLVNTFKPLGIRTSIFVNPEIKMVEAAAKTGTDRIELYTEPYANFYKIDKKQAIQTYIESSHVANKLGLEINAGHDLDLNNLQFFNQNIEGLKEVSIGHALVCDSLYLGLEETIKRYLNLLK